MDTKELVLLDTDIGTDIDDALCLSYLLRHPRCELLGITTVSGDTRRRAMLADAICRAHGRADTPIHPGAAGRRGARQSDPPVHQASILERWDHRSDFEICDALEFMQRTIRRYPGSVTLLGIGPLTNIAMLFSLDPELPSLLKRLVLMCGGFKLGGPGQREWNAMVDPEATALVYETAVSEHITLGQDVTYRCVIPLRLAQEIFATKLPQIIAEATAVWAPVRQRQHPYVYFHDPLAAAAIFEPELCLYERGTVTVEQVSPVSRGATYWTPQPSGPHTIAVEVDARAFFDHYFTTVTGSPLGELYGDIEDALRLEVAAAGNDPSRAPRNAL